MNSASGDVFVYMKQHMALTSVMVDGQFDCLRAEVGDVDLNLAVAGEHAPR